MSQGTQRRFPVLLVSTCQHRGVLFRVQVALWRQVQATVPVLALRSADKLQGVEGIIVLFDLRQV